MQIMAALLGGERMSRAPLLGFPLHTVTSCFTS